MTSYFGCWYLFLYVWKEKTCSYTMVPIRCTGRGSFSSSPPPPPHPLVRRVTQKGHGKTRVNMLFILWMKVIWMKVRTVWSQSTLDKLILGKIRKEVIFHCFEIHQTYKTQRLRALTKRQSHCSGVSLPQHWQEILIASSHNMQSKSFHEVVGTHNLHLFLLKLAQFMLYQVCNLQRHMILKLMLS